MCFFSPHSCLSLSLSLYLRRVWQKQWRRVCSIPFALTLDTVLDGVQTHTDTLVAQDATLFPCHENDRLVFFFFGWRYRRKERENF